MSETFDIDEIPEGKFTTTLKIMDKINRNVPTEWLNLNEQNMNEVIFLDKGKLISIL